VLEGRSLPSFGFAAAVPTGNAVATDAAGNVYVAGGNAVAKYSQAGALQWSETMGVNSRGIAVDGSGNVFITGIYTSTATFGATTLTTGQTDAYAAKLDTNGNVLWARGWLTVAGKVVDRYEGARIAVDSAGNAYVTDSIMTATYIDDTVVVRLDGATGATQWADRLAGVSSGGHNSLPGDTEFPVIAVGGGNVYVVGSFLFTVDFDPGPGTYTLTSGGSGRGDGFVVKLTTSGAFVWADAFATGSGGRTASVCNPNGVAVDAAGNVFVSGTFSGVVDFDPAAGGKKGQGQLPLNAAAGPIFVTKLTPTGSLAWARQLGAGTNPSAGSVGGEIEVQAAGSVAVDATGAVYLTGAFTGTTNFNPAGGGTLTSAGGADAYVVKLDANEAFQWAARAGGAGDDYGSAVVVDGSGNVDLAGYIDLASAAGYTASFGDPSHTLTTATTTAVLWQITQP
jgi:hypothetical protein